MPSIHVIWDPCDKVRIPINDATWKHTDAQLAVIQNETFDENNIEGVIESLVKLLLRGVVDG